ncbi:DUF4190 domain-containing protein [Streptococcus sp. 121]|uniref:DUF4190 domain-containing protein n=1 Tax=Streptococcus sp. 121 TaxID=2797637 RepID=UPI0018F0A4BF|nr:DUF4190 domain-containing protein [Streptococcus sp. 121]MBJ6746222.1 DUF4190 domain-containing protein [Streptococcus sp. 121]
MDQKPESHVLGIIALTLAVLALLGSWVPFLNYISCILALIALVLGIIELYNNWKNKKALGIVSTALAVSAIGIFLMTQSVYEAIVKEIYTNYETYLEDDEAYTESEFTWTQKDYDDLVLGDGATGAGGTNLKDVISRFGEPTSTSDGTAETDTQRFQTKTAYYESSLYDDYRSVTLTFVKQENGDWLLVFKSATDLDTHPEEAEQETVT